MKSIVQGLSLAATVVSAVTALGESSRLGTLSVSDFFVESLLLVEEGRETRFDLQNTFVGIDWHHDQIWRAHFELGQLNLRGVPARFGALPSSDELGVTEAYVESLGFYGRARAGLIPLEFGYEGEVAEAELLMTRSLLFQLRRVGLRDFGVSYRVAHGGFYTQLIVHNGESGSELDDRLWHTGSWGWRRGDFHLGVAATTGKTTAASSFQSGNRSIETVFDPQFEANWRLGLLRLEYLHRPWAVHFEVYTGKVQQAAANNEFHGGHIDLLYRIGRYMSLQLRYDVIEPDIRRSGDRVAQASAALSLHNRLKTFRFLIEGVTELEPLGTQAADRIQFVWRLSPLSGLPF